MPKNTFVSIRNPNLGTRTERSLISRLSTTLILHTWHYRLYDPHRKKVGDAVTHPYVKFDDYDSYTLLMMPTATDVAKFLKSGVRLGDHHIALVIESGVFSKKQLCENWRADFDNNGMTRGLRRPLGHVARQYVEAGQKDCEGMVIKDAGFYYLWHRGLHMLGGKEAMDAGIYLKRPSHEADICARLSVRAGYRAAVRLPPASSTTPFSPLQDTIPAAMTPGRRKYPVISRLGWVRSVPLLLVPGHAPPQRLRNIVHL